MLRDKNTFQQPVSEKKDEGNVKPDAQDKGYVSESGTAVTEEIPFDQTPLIGIYNEVAAILRELRVDPTEPESPPLFRTVKFDTNQMNRIKHDRHNYEGVVAWPAAFIHFIDINWLVSAARVGEGTADMRIKFVLSRLNNMDDEYQTEGFSVFQRIKSAIVNNMGRISKHAVECRLEYFDPVETMEEGLQEYWMTYKVRFMDYTDYLYKDYVERYLVVPPFTNHSDQNKDIRPADHGDHIEDADDHASLKTTFQ